MSTSKDQVAVRPVRPLALTLALRVVRGADAAALSVVHEDGDVVTIAASDAAAQLADELQHATGEGPGLAAHGDDTAVHVPDVRREERWPTWARALLQHSEHRSVLVSRPFVIGGRTGVLTFYSTRAHAFDQEDAERAALVAAHVASTIRSTQEVAGLEAAMDSQTVLGQALGILMERHGSSEEEAMSLLARLASDGDRTVRDLATEITGTSH